MRAKLFWSRSLSILLMLALTMLSSLLAGGMFLLCSKFNGQGIYPVLLLFGDALVPLALFIPALFFRNRFLSLAAILCSFFNIFFRLSSIIIFKETFMPMDYESIKMLLEHLDFYALEAALGSCFYYWMIPVILLAVAAVALCCVVVWRDFGKKSRKTVKKWLNVFLVLFYLSLVSNLLFHIIQSMEYESYIQIRPLPFVSMELANNTIRELTEKKNFETVPLPENSLKILKKEKMIVSDDGEVSAGEALFDRIIIIAVESLDYDFIGGSNPRMPEGITPELDRIGQENISMSNYYSASLPTSWGLNSMLLSRLDYEKDRFIRLPSFFTIAREKGYYTWYFSAASGLFGNNRQVYQNLFDADKLWFFEEWNKDYKFDKFSDWGVSDEMLFEGVYQELKRSGKKRFAALISTIDTHPPYSAADKIMEKGSGDGEKTRFPGKFLPVLHNTDRCIGKFVDRITADGELFDERSLLIITADHTATHGENYLQRRDFLPERVPLIFIMKNRNLFKNLERKKFASSIDLAPTLVKLIGGKVPPSFMGRDLFSDKDLAVCRYYGDVLLIHGPGFFRQVNCFQEPTDDFARAFIDFYRSHYGR